SQAVRVFFVPPPSAMVSWCPSSRRRVSRLSLRAFLIFFIGLLGERCSRSVVWEYSHQLQCSAKTKTTRAARLPALRLRPTLGQHRVAVGEEAVAQAQGFLVGGEDSLSAGEGRDQHQQGR